VDLVAVCPCGATTHEVAENFAPLPNVPCWVRCWACGQLTPARRFEWRDGFTWLPDGFPSMAARPRGEARDADALRRQIYGLLASTMRSIQWLDSRFTDDDVGGILAAIERANTIVRRDRYGRSVSELRSALSELERVEELLHEAMIRP
jgi:hypothetical protein